MGLMRYIYDSKPEATFQVAIFVNTKFRLS